MEIIKVRDYAYYEDAIEILASVTKKLGESADWSLLDRIHFSLAWDFMAHIDGIYTDMWSIVKVVRSHYPENNIQGMEIVVECYNILPGLAKAWSILEENFVSSGEFYKKRKQ